MQIDPGSRRHDRAGGRHPVPERDGLDVALLASGVRQDRQAGQASIVLLFQEQTRQIAILEAMVAESERRLGLNSSNSDAPSCQKLRESLSLVPRRVVECNDRRINRCAFVNSKTDDIPTFLKLRR